METLLKSTYDGEEEDDPLQKQFKSLEMEWDSIKHSFSRSNRRSSSTVAGNHLLFQLYDSSPKELMSLLQNESSPNSGYCDRAAIEVIKQPEADFDDGRLRGRRLFEESDLGSDDYGGCSDMDEKSVVSTEYSHMGSEHYDENCTEICGFQHSCTTSLPSDVAERGVMVVGLKGGGVGVGGGFVGRWWICVVIMLFALAIVAFKCSGEDEQILVPT